jgi:hypothetical protein
MINDRVLDNEQNFSQKKKGKKKGTGTGMF